MYAWSCSEPKYREKRGACPLWKRDMQQSSYESNRKPCAAHTYLSVRARLWCMHASAHASACKATSRATASAPSARRFRASVEVAHMSKQISRWLNLSQREGGQIRCLRGVS
eukprot:scaffold59296_cov20-Tisochrysis_lutea.AAC.1